jgi:hypothetical protein
MTEQQWVWSHEAGSVTFGALEVEEAVTDPSLVITVGEAFLLTSAEKRAVSHKSK